MKYVRVVDAVQWTGQDLDGVREDWDHYMGIQVGHIYMSPTGRYQKISQGNWLVTEEDGNKIVMTDEDFTKMFSPYYGELPVAEEIARLYTRISQLENEVSTARFGGKCY
jgi:hypothetical protein